MAGQFDRGLLEGDGSAVYVSTSCELEIPCDVKWYSIDNLKNEDNRYGKMITQDIFDNATSSKIKWLNLKFNRPCSTSIDVRLYVFDNIN